MSSSQEVEMQANAAALGVSQNAPQFLQKQAASLQLPRVLSGLNHRESLEMWSNHEKLLLSCLRTGDDKSALVSLERLMNRFGNNERVEALRGIYQEAVAEDKASLLKVLHEYERITRDNPTNVPILKRRIAILRDLSRHSEAISALVELLDISPNDIEAWSELSDLYFSQGLYDQAVFCLEEVLLTVPNAWNAHARIGEILLMSSQAPSTGSDTVALLALFEAVQRFCRSVELCSNYVRGLYGLKIATDRILQTPNDKLDHMRNQNLFRPSIKAVRDLNDRVTASLNTLTNEFSQSKAIIGEDQIAALVAAQKLLAAT